MTPAIQNYPTGSLMTDGDRDGTTGGRSGRVYRLNAEFQQNILNVLTNK